MFTWAVDFDGATEPETGELRHLETVIRRPPATDGPGMSDDESEGESVLDTLGQQEGWRIEGDAARVHYRGATDRYSIEYYHPSECVLYWKVPPEEVDTTAVPVGRGTVPEPLRERVREDLATAGIDPDVEERSL